MRPASCEGSLFFADQKLCPKGSNLPSWGISLIGPSRHKRLRIVQVDHEINRSTSEVFMHLPSKPYNPANQLCSRHLQICSFQSVPQQTAPLLLKQLLKNAGAKRGCPSGNRGLSKYHVIERGFKRCGKHHVAKPYAYPTHTVGLVPGFCDNGSFVLLLYCNLFLGLLSCTQQGAVSFLHQGQLGHLEKHGQVQNELQLGQ